MTIYSRSEQPVDILASWTEGYLEPVLFVLVRYPDGDKQPLVVDSLKADGGLPEIAKAIALADIGAPALNSKYHDLMRRIILARDKAALQAPMFSRGTKTEYKAMWEFLATVINHLETEYLCSDYKPEK